jgi:glycosyltransferase involved in cell wall biosynthesis
MQILFDNIIYSLQSAGGISTYWYEITSRMLENKHDIIFIESNKINNLCYNNLKNIDRNVIRFKFPFIIFNRFLSVRTSQFKKKYIFHSSYNRISSNSNAINVITIHDFIHEKYYNGIRKFLHSWQKTKVINKSDFIITVSQNTKIDLLALHPNLNPNKVKVVYNGVSTDFFYDENLNRTDKNSFILFVGSREKYKNFDFVVDCVGKLTTKKLYIVGSKLNRREISLLKDKLPNRWILFNGISNKDLNILYNNAFALMYLSSYEGFGIPLLESMKTGCPFIALNTSSIPEVAGNAGVLIPVLEYQYVSKALINIEKCRDIIISKGFLQSSKFSWDKCFDETLKIYLEIFNK